MIAFSSGLRLDFMSGDGFRVARFMEHIDVSIQPIAMQGIC